MLTSLQRLIGMPVVLRDCRIGFVERAFADPSLRRLEGVVIRRGLGSARWLRGSQILLAGRTCLLADGTPARMPRIADETVRHAYLVTGEYAGVVSDVVLDAETLLAGALEISRSPSGRLMGQCMYTAQYSAASCKENVTAGELLTWPQLRKLLGEEDRT